jgi:hypothetical protein
MARITSDTDGPKLLIHDAPLITRPSLVSAFRAASSVVRSPPARLRHEQLRARRLGEMKPALET